MIFSVENGSFAYKEQQVLKNISFTVNQSEVLAVLGPNGVGKTTLLRCMMGLLPWSKGNSLLDGENIKGINTRVFWSKIAYVPQQKGTALSFSAIEMVLMGCSARLGVFAQPSATDILLAEKSMEDVGISHLKNKQCSRMSGGELQMVLIARALTAQPQMLVFDEPESNLDFKNQLIILETISKLSRKNAIAAIINTHYPAHALKIADQALILSHDKSSEYGKVNDVVTEANMKKSFDVEVKIQDFLYNDCCYKSVIPISAVS